MTKQDTNEQARLAALCALGMLDTPAEPRFDKLTALASAALGMPIALVSLIDSQRQWFKSRHGIDLAETPRTLAFCSYAIDSGEIFIVNDAAQDARFLDNPLVTGHPHIRFYAGHPLFSHDGQAVGTLCVIDAIVRHLAPAQLALLKTLAGLVEAELNRDSLALARSHALGQKTEALNREIRQRADVEASLRRSEERVRAMIDSSAAAFVATDAAAHIIEWNGAAERMFGWSRAEVLGRPWSSIMVDLAPPDAAARHSVRLAARTSAGAGIIVDVSVSGFVVDGQHCLGAYIHDVSAQIAVARALARQQQLLDAVLETVDCAIVACDSEGTLSLYNRAAHAMLGRAAAGLAGVTVCQADGETVLLPHQAPLARALAGESVGPTRLVLAGPGLARRTVSASARPLRDPSGRAQGALLALRDIGELVDAEDKLGESEQMLRSIAENLPTLIAQVDKQGRFVYLNARSRNFYGLPPDQLLGRSVRSVYSEADYASIAGYIETAAAGKGVSFESDIGVGDRHIYYHAALVPHRDVHGAPDGFFAMAFDITARRHSEIAQRDSEERLRTITDNVPVLISYLDGELRYQFANAMYKEWLGVPSAQMIGRTVTEVFGPDYFDERAPSIARAMSGHMASVEVTVLRRGHERILNTTYMPHHRDGKVVGVYVLGTDATAARAHERKLLALANADPLTNLPNRRMYEFQLAKALAVSKRQQSRLALMYLDLDDFKRINDTYGHGVGDAVLVEFGKRVGASLRASDLLARLAGDEFTVVLEAIDSPANCEAVAHKIALALHEPFHVDGLALLVTASIGIALADPGATIASLSARADEALYVAKRKGKNRYVVQALAD
jgi:diguanylate cyclase (GGDEF)-like protein/PAS domain S-box-containing protein